MSAPINLGAWRDRSNLFISYRQSYAHHPAKRSRFAASGNGVLTSTDLNSERAGLMSDMDTSGDAVIEMDLLPPRWLDVQDEIDTQLSDVTAKMKALDQLHAKHVLPGFDDDAIKAREQREIDALAQEITRRFGACQRAINRIDVLLRDQKQRNHGSSSADETMARNLKISLATRVGDVSTLFRKKQAAYLKKLRSLGGMTTPLERAGSPALAAQNPYTDAAMMDEEADRSSAQSTLQQTAQVRRRTGALDATIAQREREIESIAQGVIDLSNIFQELNAMVIDQGSLLDRIDYNVERTAEDLKSADTELKVATTYQKKGTKRRIILLLVLLVVGMVILLIVKPKGRGRTAAPAPSQPQQPAAPPPGDGGQNAGGGMGQQPPSMRVVRGNDEVGGLAASSPPSRRRWEWKQRRRRRGGNEGFFT